MSEDIREREATQGPKLQNSEWIDACSTSEERVITSSETRVVVEDYTTYKARLPEDTWA